MGGGGSRRPPAAPHARTLMSSGTLVMALCERSTSLSLVQRKSPGPSEPCSSLCDATSFRRLTRAEMVSGMARSLFCRGGREQQQPHRSSANCHFLLG